jgi:hypothetical protein
MWNPRTLLSRFFYSIKNPLIVFGSGVVTSLISDALRDQFGTTASRFLVALIPVVIAAIIMRGLYEALLSQISKDPVNGFGIEKKKEYLIDQGAIISSDSLGLVV